MEYLKTKQSTGLARMLGIAFMTMIFLTIILLWGHVQGRSNHLIDLYFAYCKELD